MIVRGRGYRDTDLYVAQSILMSKYNQQYSEIDNIPLKTVLFLLNLTNSERQYEEAEMKKAKAKMKNKGRGRKL